jgi:hypothetical protein
MMKTSSLPPKPADPVRRVIRIALFDGWSVAIVAGLGGLLAAAMGDFIGAAIGVMAAGAGLVELHGVTLLRRSEPSGLKWLVGSQFLLMGSLLAYCAFQLAHPQLAALRRAAGPMLEDQLAASGLNPGEFLALLYRIIYYAVAAATIAYQGGMSLFYLSQRKAVALALGQPPALPTSGP